jgi:hypothetical protein
MAVGDFILLAQNERDFIPLLWPWLEGEKSDDEPVLGEI